MVTKKITLLLIITAFIGFNQYANSQGVFTSAATGNWNTAGTWTLNSGSDTDNIPDADDNVTIGSAHRVTLTANAECVNITLLGVNSGTRLAIGNFTLSVSGTLNGDGTTLSGTLITCGTGRLKFIGDSRALFGSSWAGNPHSWRWEVALNNGQTGTATTAVKGGEIFITSGTFSSSNEIRPDKNSSTTGDLTIENGAVVTCTRLSQSSTANTLFGNLTINGNGKLLFTNAATYQVPVGQSCTYSDNAIIEYQGSANTIADINYPNLVINTAQNSTLKTWSPASNRLAKSITITKGNLYLTANTCTVNGNIQVDATGTISAASASSRYIASGTRTFTLNGNAIITANETENASATSPFSYQYNGFSTYAFDAASWVSFRSPTSTPVTQGIDGITGVPFGNLEIAGNTNLTTAGTNTHKFVTNIEIAGHLAFPRATGTTNTSLAINFQDKTIKVGKDIKLGGITADAIAGGRTYDMGTSTIELNGTTAQSSSLGGTNLPSSYYNLKINNTHSNGVQLGSAITVNGTTTISQKFTTINTITANGPVNIDATGIFQLNDGGWATGSGTWTYTTGGKLNFYATATYGVSNSDVFWPASNSPSIVQVIQGGLTMNSCNRTVGGTLIISSGVTLNSSVLTIDGTVQINANGFFANAPTLGSSSTLKYNTGATFGRGIEWNNPANVTISNNTTLNYPNGSTAARTITGNLTVDAGSSFYMDYGSPGLNNPFTIAGNVVLNGNLSLGDAVGGDIYVGGNWTRAATGSSFNSNSRAVYLNGSGLQTVTNTAGETFPYLFINNTGSGVTLANNVSGTQINISAGSKLTNSATLTATTLNINSSSSGTGTYIDNGTTSATAVNVQQYLADARNWYVSSPVSNGVAPAGYTYYQRDEAGASWTSQPFVAGNTFVAGKGYIALPNAAASTLTFSGALNTGNVTIPLTWAGAASKGFNLIGNPYPSHLTWTQAFAESTSTPGGGTAPATLIEPSIYIRTNTGGTSNNSGIWSFQTYNASTGIAVPNHSLLSGGIIPPMQAFWVKAKEAGNLVLNSDLTKSHQTGNPLKAPTFKNTERQIIRLEVSNGTRTDETLMLFDANAIDGYDKFDSPKFAEANTEVQLYTTVGTEKLVMNGMKEMPLNQEIPLSFIPGTATSFNIKANEVSNLPSDIRVILKDYANNGLETDLTDGTASYQFSPVTNNTNRFSLLFRAPGVTTNVDTNKALSQVFVNESNQINIIAQENSNYAIYNATGQLIENGFTNFKLYTVNCKLNKGVYLVKVNNQSTRVIIK